MYTGFKNALETNQKMAKEPLTDNTGLADSALPQSSSLSSGLTCGTVCPDLKKKKSEKCQN